MGSVGNEGQASYQYSNSDVTPSLDSKCWTAIEARGLEALFEIEVRCEANVGLAVNYDFHSSVISEGNIRTSPSGYAGLGC